MMVISTLTFKATLTVNNLSESHIFSKCQHVLKNLINVKFCPAQILVLPLVIIVLRILACHIQRSIWIILLIKRGALLGIVELYTDPLSIVRHNSIEIIISNERRAYMSISKLISGLLLGGNVRVLYI